MEGMSITGLDEASKAIALDPISVGVSEESGLCSSQEFGVSQTPFRGADWSKISGRFLIGRKFFRWEIS